MAREWHAIARLLAQNVAADDRRRVVNSGALDGRDSVIAAISALAEVGVKHVVSEVIAIRGERLVLSRTRSAGSERPEAFRVDALDIVEIDADGRIASHVAVDVDDIDAAFEELEARYVAGEAADHTHAWSVIAKTFAAMNRRDLPPTSPAFTHVDRRHVATIPAGALIPSIRAAWDQLRDFASRIETVHRLTDLGAAFTNVVHGTSQDGFDAEWREIVLATVDGDLINHIEVFDEADLDAALARFDQLSRPAPRLENAVTQVAQRFWMYFATRDWDAMAGMLADGYYSDDRRRVVGAGVRHGRDGAIPNMRTIADLGFTNAVTTAIATRGHRLGLIRSVYSGRGQETGTVVTDVLSVAEVNAANRIAAIIVFDSDDIDAAFAELDARYLAGEAAPHAHTWSVIAEGYGAFNRRELLATTPEWENVDHRRGAAFAPGDMIAYIHAAWDDSPDTKIYVAAVHRLSNLGGVVTHVAHGISQEGFDAEWRDIHILTVEGQGFSRCELFDETDLDAAIARFDDLSRPAPQLENAASRTFVRFNAYLAARDWDAMAELIADDVCNDDRRHVVSGGVQRGRNAQIANLRAVIDVGVRNIKSVTIAIRGERLALTRTRVSGGDQQPEAFGVELLNVVEINTDNRIVAGVLFDLNDIGAALEELDARYLAGEAAAHAHTWSLVSEGFAGLNRREVPATTADFVNVDHRRVTAVALGDLVANLRAVWNQVPDISVYLETVHRLSDLGAVVTHAVHGTSQEGFEAEWREIHLVTRKGELFNRSEMFDEADMEAALARFDELSRPAPRLENAASQLHERFQACFAARDWDAIAELFADDTSTDDRRPVLGVGIRRGRDAVIADWRATADVGVQNITSTIIATRGDRVVLNRYRFSGRDQRPEAFRTEVLGVIEIESDQRIAECVMLDLDDVDGAFEELDARYLAGEAAAHAQTWSVITKAFAAVNRHDLPELTPDWVNVDHRRAASFAPGQLAAYTRATWEQLPDVMVYVEAVHRLTDFGAVVTQMASGTSQEGFHAEWHESAVYTVEDDRLSRCELFDEADIDAAIARFDELSRPAS
jgi:ketosteroid isomerase-like protein